VTREPDRLPFSETQRGGSTNLEFIPIKENEGPKRVPKHRGSLRLYWIIWESTKAPLSGGFTLGTSPI